MWSEYLIVPCSKGYLALGEFSLAKLINPDSSTSLPNKFSLIFLKLELEPYAHLLHNPLLFNHSLNLSSPLLVY